MSCVIFLLSTINSVICFLPSVSPSCLLLSSSAGQSAHRWAGNSLSTRHSLHISLILVHLARWRAKSPWPVMMAISHVIILLFNRIFFPSTLFTIVYLALGVTPEASWLGLLFDLFSFLASSESLPATTVLARMSAFCDFVSPATTVLARLLHPPTRELVSFALFSRCALQPRRQWLEEPHLVQTPLLSWSRMSSLLTFSALWWDLASLGNLPVAFIYVLAGARAGLFGVHPVSGHRRCPPCPCCSSPHCPCQRGNQFWHRGTAVVLPFDLTLLWKWLSYAFLLAWCAHKDPGGRQHPLGWLMVMV